MMLAYLFGNFRIATDTQSEIELRPTAARLFAFLLLYRQSIHLREVVAENFWKDSRIGLARRSLNTTLWQLRIALRQTETHKTNVIATTNTQIGINDDAGLWLDVALFEDAANRGMAHTKAGQTSRAIGALEEAVALYQADLLTNFYDSWVINERERLRLLYLRCLTHLMLSHHQKHNLKLSIEYAKRILHVEPWREEVHRELMTLYAKNGRRARAIKQYQMCRQILAAELAVPPTEETEALHQRLLTNVNGGHLQTVSMVSQPSHLTSGFAQAPTLQEATTQLQAAVQTMREAQNALDHAVALVERLIQT